METWLLEPTISQRMLESYNKLVDNPDFIAMKRTTAPQSNLAPGHFMAVRQQIAVIRVTGIITARYDPWFHDIYDYVALDMMIDQVKKVLADEAIKAIVFFIDSPGGDVTGTNEFAQLLYEARKTKPLIAYVIGSMCSGALWAFSACHMVFADPTARLGSVGVVSQFVDQSKYYDRQGVKFMEVVSTRSPNKRLNPVKGEGLKQTIKLLDDIADVFINGLAKHYDVTYEQIMENFGQGSVFVGQTALQLGMCHALISFEELISQLQNQVDPQQIAEKAVKAFTPIQSAAPDRLLTMDLSTDGQQSIELNGDEMAKEDKDDKNDLNANKDDVSLETLFENTKNLAEDVGGLKDTLAAQDKTIEEQNKTVGAHTETIKNLETEVSELKQTTTAQAEEISALKDQIKVLKQDDDEDDQELLGGGTGAVSEISKMI